MPDMTTVYRSNSLGVIRVCEMHPNHARNALALVLSNEDEARRQFNGELFSSEQNQNLHARAAGLGWVCITRFPVASSSRSSNVGGIQTMPVPRYAMRRDEARTLMRTYKTAGMASAFYRITDAGALQKSR